MQFEYFAGPVFSPQFLISISAVLFVIAGALAGIIIFWGWNIFNTVTARKSKNKVSFSRAILLGYALVAAVLLFVVLPIMVRNNHWKNKQQSCAREVGYASPSPAEDNSGSVTAELQTAYRLCLDR